MSSRWAHYLVLCLWAGCVLATNLGGAKLWDRDEPRNAGCAAEMLARGDWVVPVFNAELRTHKPVLLYWLIMASYSLVGINEWGARLPSALLSVGTVLCTYEMGRRLFAPRVGLWAGMMLATSLLFVMAGRAATPDATLIFCSTLALTVYVLGTFREPRSSGLDHSALPAVRANCFPERWPIVAAMYGCLGLAMLAKGPVGLVVPCAVIGLFLLIVRLPAETSPRDSITDTIASRIRYHARRAAGCFSPAYFLKTCWLMRPLTAVAVSLFVAAPWYAWVGWRTEGEFLRGFFLEHNLSRATQAMEGHQGNLLFYPCALLVGCFPWSVFAAPWLIDTVRRLRRPDPWRNGYLFAIAWIAVYVGLFSLAQTKLPSYVTPCYPALALIGSAFLDRLLAGVGYADRRWQFASYGVFALVGVGILVAVPWAASQVLPGEGWLGLLGVVPCLGGLVCLALVARRRDQQAAWGFAFASFAFVTMLAALGTQRVSSHQQYEQLWAEIRSRSDAPRIAAFGCLEPSWVFYGGWPVEEVTHASLGPTHDPQVEVAGRWVPKPPVLLDELVAEHPDRTPFVITTARQLAGVQQLLPPDWQVIHSVPLFLKRDQLVLLGPSRSRLARRTK